MNTTYIEYVQYTEPAKYTVYFSNNSYKPTRVYDSLYKQNYESKPVIACEKDDPEAYKAIDDWIKSLPANHFCRLVNNK